MAAAFAIIFSLEPGTESWQRRSLFTRSCMIWVSSWDWL